MKTLYNEANEMFGETRDLTKEEQVAYIKGLESISTPTGISMFDEIIIGEVKGEAALKCIEEINKI